MMELLVQLELAIILLLLMWHTNSVHCNAIRHPTAALRRKLLQKVEFKYALQTCRVPTHCQWRLIQQLMQKESLSECDGIEYGHLVTCVETSWLFLSFSILHRLINIAAAAAAVNVRVYWRNNAYRTAHQNTKPMEGYPEMILR
ncbi:hypothetical protein Tcan_16159 [Toxocara canis]|uniref:Secreted protein n=1 Tax=Toxocara canis TaxID=6265 RepID=A0A0B2VVH2_TOXCA|nr:hypothetical protein Tcan_16159 [Toxocara canis]